ncbi:hypothetical protein MTQ10_14290 [Streptomyces sp. XM83C]|jgi:hypothetical protein|uniref:Uncharacterized protein n=1 Tax=Streptomyces thermocoprophilus TaxID=78356 RepID=A0ABV5VH88_9ACTN|nr:hypothetical protein [Streptomyces sp. XM83C]MCK1820750.1 hypothetical protein [Streptomyces sp. XM83C]
MPTAVLTDRERTAVQAYLRLLRTVRASFAEGGGAGALPVPPSVLAEAEEALAGAGLAGNEEEFFRLLRRWGAPG